MRQIIWMFITWQLFRFNSNFERDYQRVIKIEPMTRGEYMGARVFGGSSGFYWLGIGQPGKHPFYNRK